MKVIVFLQLTCIYTIYNLCINDHFIPKTILNVLPNLLKNFHFNNISFEFVYWVEFWLPQENESSILECWNAKKFFDFKTVPHSTTKKFSCSCPIKSLLLVVPLILFFRLSYSLLNVCQMLNLNLTHVNRLGWGN